jgi:hypothetical protein
MRFVSMTDATYLIDQAKRCRRLAAGINDPGTVATLLQMAEDFERRAAPIANEAQPPIST